MSSVSRPLQDLSGKPEHVIQLKTLPKIKLFVLVNKEQILKVLLIVSSYKSDTMNLQLKFNFKYINIVVFLFPLFMLIKS